MKSNEEREIALLFRREYGKTKDRRAFELKFIGDAVIVGTKCFEFTFKAQFEYGVELKDSENPPRGFQLCYGPEWTKESDLAQDIKRGRAEKPTYFWLRMTSWIQSKRKIPARFKRNAKGLLTPTYI